MHFASDYFDQLYAWAEKLVKDGHAYVCDLSGEETREYRGTLTEPGRNSPFRDRTPEENLDLFAACEAGEFPDGSRTLRAKIDMASPNLNLRDPVMYRILRAHPSSHRRHVVHLSDVRLGARAKRFDRRDHVFDLHAGVRKPSAAVRLVLRQAANPSSPADRVRAIEPELHGDEQTQVAAAWSRKDTSTAGTIRGCRRSAGCAAAATRPNRFVIFATDVGVAKFNSTIDIVRLENAVREHLNRVAPRRMAVLDPVKLTITNWPAGRSK